MADISIMVLLSFFRDQVLCFPQSSSATSENQRFYHFFNYPSFLKSIYEELKNMKKTLQLQISDTFVNVHAFLSKRVGFNSEPVAIFVISRRG